MTCKTGKTYNENTAAKKLNIFNTTQRNWPHILHRLGDMADYWSNFCCLKNGYLYLTHSFRRNRKFGTAKFDLKKLETSYGAKHVSIFRAVYAWITSVTDRQTDRQTDSLIANAALHYVARKIKLFTYLYLPIT